MPEPEEGDTPTEVRQDQKAPPPPILDELDEPAILRFGEPEHASW
jgi:hypothetical protein